MRSSLFILSFLFINFTLFAQKYSHELSGHFGRISRHTEKLTLPIENNTWGAEYAFEYQTLGKAQWHKWAKYPRLGLALSFQNFGNKEELGYGLGIAPYISTDFWRSDNDKFRLFGRLSLGFGYVSKHYDVATNPRNNFVGSHWSNCSIFKFGADIALIEHWRLRPSISLTHYSNASSQLPNFGINVLAFQIGLLYTPNSIALTQLPAKPNYDKNKGTVEEKPLHRKHYIFSLNTGFGLRESMTNRGPKYPVYYANMEMGKYISNLVRLRVGLDFDYVGSVMAFLDNMPNYSKKESHWQASRFSIVGGLEYVWNRVSLSTQIGIYLTQHEMQQRFFYVRALIRIYPFNSPLNEKRSFNPYILIGLKTHMITAEYASFGLGFNL